MIRPATAHSLLPRSVGTIPGWAWPHISVWVLSFGVRVLHVLSLAGSDPMFAHPVMDARWHVEWARGLAIGLGQEGAFFRAPLYPYCLAALFKLFGTSLLVPRVVQAAIGACGSVLVLELGRRLGGRTVGLLAGVAAALYGPLVYFDAEFLVETIFLPLVMASLLLAASARHSSSLPGKRAWSKWAGAGLAAGLATIARPNLLIVAPAIIVWIALETPAKRRWGAVACWFALFALPVGGVTAYNAAKGGGLVLVASQGGVNFWIGNNRIADGKTVIFPPYHGPATKPQSAYRDSVEFNAELEAEKRLGRELRDGEVSNYWFGQGVKFILDEPGAWSALTLKKLYFLLNGYELPSNREMYRVRRWSPILATLLWDRPLAFPFGVILPLGMVGMLLASRAPSPERSLHRLLVLYIVVYGIGVVAFFVTARHRVPIVPPLIVYASLALASLPGGIATLRSRKLSKPLSVLVGCLVFVGGLAVSNTRFFGIRDYHRGEHCMNLGYAYAQQRRFEDALTEFRAAIEEEPRFVRALFNVGAVYAAMGRPDEARQALRQALEIDPKYVDAWVELGRINSEMRNFREAEETFRRALELSPRNALAHYGMALTYLGAWDFEGYTRHLSLAHQSDPDFAPANLAIAELLVEQGRPLEAREYVRRAARINPDDPRLRKLVEATGK